LKLCARVGAAVTDSARAATEIEMIAVIFMGGRP
jgi:hypothetical protein